MIREAILAATAGQSLSMDDAVVVMREVMEGEVTPAQLGSYLTALSLKGETPEELAGFATVMRDKSLRVSVEGTAIDTCGTGGDRKGTFNISTAAAFVVAGAGLTVAKHGNRAASGDCGSADVLEALGVRIELPPEAVERCLREIGIGFMFAPAYHPAMRYAAPVRREIGIRTVFNVLGPMTNPAGVSCQLIGVGYPEAANKMAEALRLFGTHHAIIVHSDDGMDELSLGSDTAGWEVLDGEIRPYVVRPRDLGLPHATPDDLRGGDPAANAATMRAILSGSGGPVRDAVMLNSGAALVAGDVANTLPDGIEMAAASISDGRAAEKLDAMVSLTRELGPVEQ
ncbi:MAG: anthranilate phosphoribosyltransferase [Chloroflexi bacterium]|nr:anthranilate phosphoribosyltransferase [Chloroflexota bacterium]